MRTTLCTHSEARIGRRILRTDATSETSRNEALLGVNPGSVALFRRCDMVSWRATELQRKITVFRYQIQSLEDIVSPRPSICKILEIGNDPSAQNSGGNLPLRHLSNSLLAIKPLWFVTLQTACRSERLKSAYQSLVSCPTIGVLVSVCGKNNTCKTVPCPSNFLMIWH